MLDPAVADLLDGYTDAELAAMLAELERQFFPDARPQQMPPCGDWSCWYVRGGRGSGKTRTGCEQFCDWLLSALPADEWAIIAPTFGDGRDTCVEGPSGVLAVLKRRGVVPTWNRSMGELRMPNGSRVYVDGADDGALRIQGKNLSGAWCDEVGLWKQWQLAWDESLAFAIRVAPAKIVATGTPKVGHGLVKRLLNDPDVVVTLLRTLDNEANLHPAAVAKLRRRYEGTRLGRQELDGEYLEDVEGALWTRAKIDDNRHPAGADLPSFDEVVVAVDPSGGDDEGNDEQGILVAGRAGTSKDGHAYVLADRSCRLSPEGWGREVVQAYLDHTADRIVVEVNFGGDMAIAVIRNAAKVMGVRVKVDKVNASRGKAVRAQPVSQLYAEGRVHHVEPFVELEDQLCLWVPGVATAKSPDRLDALVWGVTALLPPEDMRTLSFRGAA